MPIPNFSMAEIRSILNSNDFGKLIGAYESDIFDAKGTPYQLNIDSQKYELAKDLAAFANANGGYIVIGLSTHPAPGVATDEVNEVRPFESGLVNPGQHLAIARERVYPRIAGLDARWRENTGTPGRGLLVIEIPPQREEDKYFLVNGVYDQGTRIPQTVFGIPTRTFSVNQPITIVQLHHLVQTGRETGPRLDRIERKLDRLEEPAPLPDPENRQDAVKRRINRLLDEVKDS